MGSKFRCSIEIPDASVVRHDVADARGTPRQELHGKVAGFGTFEDPVYVHDSAAGGRDVNGRFRQGVSGNPAKRFQPGISGNPTGRPKTFSIHQLVAEAIDDKETRAEAVKRVQENLKNRRRVLSALELAARLNREIGLGSEDRASHAARCVARHGVHSHPVPVALVGECPIPVV